MLKLSLGAAAIFGVATLLDSTTFRPISNLVLDFFILGKLPFLPIRITFDMIFLTCMAALIYFVGKKLWLQGKEIIAKQINLDGYYSTITL